jgi:protein-disulfide isomerase
MSDLAEEFPDVRFEFRDSPTQDSIILAIGARCAGEQGKFWEMHDLIFNYQDDLSVILNEVDKKLFLNQMAVILNLNSEDYSNCLNERRYIKQVKNDYDDGETLEIPGTPTWYVNGQRILGSLSQETFEELIMGLQNTIKE